MFMKLGSSRRATGLAIALAVMAAVSACSEADPVAPGLGLAEADTVFRTLGPDTVESNVGFAANRDGTMHLRVCGPMTTDFDASVIARVRTEGGSRVADTLATASTDSNCETLSFAAQSGTFYRVVVRSVEGEGRYFACYAFDATFCEGIEPDPAPEPETPTLTGYYASANGLSGAALLAELHDIIRTGYNGFEYDTARGYLYQDVEDPDDDNLIEEIYAGRVATVTQRFNPNTTTDAGDANFQAEHLWPQSCGARLDRTNAANQNRSTGPRGDLHVIVASDGPANNSRSNHPFGNVTSTTSQFGPDSAGDFSRLGSNGTRTVFEPRDEKKGDIARALLYFYVRYVPEIPTSLSLANFNVEEATLVEWSTQDPPDAFERARNQEVFLVQGNRNPFVDHPHLVGLIGDFPNTVTGTSATCNF